MRLCVSGHGSMCLPGHVFVCVCMCVRVCVCVFESVHMHTQLYDGPYCLSILCISPALW